MMGALVMPTIARALVALALVAGGLLTGGCADDLPTGAPLGAGGHAAVGDDLAAALAEAFTVDHRAELSSDLLVGAEWFDVRFTVRARSTRYLEAYGLKTPYETIVKPVRPRLPIAIEGGAMVLRQIHFNRIPVAGDYPLEIWLIDEAGRESNHVFTRVTVQ